MNNSLNTLHYDKICRTCLCEAEDLRSLFKPGKICGETTTLSNMLSNFFDSEINENDGFPEKVCLKCLVNISKAYTFKQQCIQSFSRLQQQIIIVETNNLDVTSNDKTESNSYPSKEIQYSSEADIDGTEAECSSASQVEENSSDRDVTDIVKIEDELPNPTIFYSDGVLPKIEFIDVVENEMDLSDSTCTDSIPPKLSFRRFKPRSKKSQGPFTCNVCSKTLSNASSFKYHLQLHSEVSTFLCSDCGKSFKTRNALDGHMITHIDSNPHTCGTCGKSYRQAASLRCHLLSHTGEKPFLCVICGKGCTQKSGLKKHMLVHSTEKPYKCNECGMNFRYSCNLVTHTRLHTGDKPYSCDACDKRFPSAEQLKRHKIVHTSDKPFTCDLCFKCFNRKSSLSTHKLTHAANRKYICKICGKSNTQLKCFNAHVDYHKDKDMSA